MAVIEELYLLRVYLKDGQRFQYTPVDQWLCQRAFELDLEGATVQSAKFGFGRDTRSVPTGIYRMTESHPLIFEAVDTRERLSHFVEEITEALDGGLVTLQPVAVYRPSNRD